MPVARPLASACRPKSRSGRAPFAPVPGRAAVARQSHPASSAFDCTRFRPTAQQTAQPDLTIEVFLMDGAVPGFGALELVDPPSPEGGEERHSSRRSVGN